MVSSALGVKDDLILVLRGQIFEYLREKKYRHAFQYLQSARSEEKMKKKLFPTETPGHYLVLTYFEGLWPVGTHFATASVLGPEQKN